MKAVTLKTARVIREVICLPAPALDRLTKKLIDKGIVKKTFVSNKRKGPTDKYKLSEKYWKPDSLVGIIVPNMLKDEEGNILLTRTRRENSKRAEKIRFLGGTKILPKQLFLVITLKLFQESLGIAA